MSKLTPFVVFEKHSGYAVIKWNCPERKNAMKPEMVGAISHYLNSVATGDSISLVLLTGVGDYYTSGADVSSDAFNNPGKDPPKGNDAFKKFLAALINFPKPIIAAVNGPAIGMGVTTLPLCDVVYASSNSTFTTPFSRVGVCPEGCSTYTFPTIMGYAKANEMLLFNRTLSAGEACACGLVADVFPQETFMDDVMRRVEEFIDNPRMSLVCGKQLIRGRHRDELFRINMEEVARVNERLASDDVALQRSKFIQRRKKLKETRAKL